MILYSGVPSLQNLCISAARLEQEQDFSISSHLFIPPSLCLQIATVLRAQEKHVLIKPKLCNHGATD